MQSVVRKTCDPKSMIGKPYIDEKEGEKHAILYWKRPLLLRKFIINAFGDNWGKGIACRTRGTFRRGSRSHLV
ncbi:hypothetical protein EMIT07CA2_30154 [Brevibacillus sp. IT-7CA2]